MRGLILIVLLLAISTVYGLTPEEKATIEKIRIVEDSMWLFASVFIVFFTYQLKKIYEGGEIERGFTLFLIAFGLIVMWKFLGVIQRVYDIEAVEDFKEVVGEAGSGFMMGVAYFVMWKLLKGEE